MKLRNLTCLIIMLTLLFLITDCTFLKEFEKDNGPDTDRVIVSYQDWKDSRIREKEKAGITGLKIKGKMNVSGEDLKKEVSLGFGVLLKDNGDEGLAIYKGMGLLVRYEKKNKNIRLEPSSNDLIPESHFLIPVIMKEVRTLFLPIRLEPEKPVSKKRIGDSVRFTFPPITYEKEDEQKTVILSRITHFYFTRLKDITYFNESSASNFMTIKLLNFQQGDLFEYPTKIYLNYFPDNLIIEFVINDLEYLDREEQ